MNSISFAYKFSRLKTKFFILLWLIVATIIAYVSIPYYQIYTSIKELQNGYVKVDFLGEKIVYTVVKEKPDQWVDLKDISKRLQWAIITSEDGKFYDHNGFDYEQFQKAFESAFILKRKKVRGASTITQQLIKNLFLSREKSISRKMKEFVFSLVIENHVDKIKILETYLNIIEYGKNIYGIKNASLFYFKKKPSQLLARESAFIAMLLPSPVKYSRSFYNKRLSPFAIKIINSVLIKMNQVGAIGIDELASETSSTFFWETAPPNLVQDQNEINQIDSINEEDLDE